VHHFASISLAENPQVLTSELKALVARHAFSRRAWVNVWDVRSSHQYLLLPAAGESELESMARHHGASVLGMRDAEVTVATTVGSSRGEPGHHPKTEVSFFAAGSQDVRDRLRPFVDAGFHVEGVTTPCGALWSQARLRRPALPDQVHAHVALGATQSALGIFSNGSLLYARDLDWGYAGPEVSPDSPQDREVLAGRLSAELRRSFLYLKQYWEHEVSQVLLCGDMPEIRSLTAPLIERLNIEVETLDTLEGIDAGLLPEGFAEQAATFRLASAIAAGPPPVNLLPVEVTATRTSITGQRIVAVGSAAAVAFGGFLYAQAGLRQTASERQLAGLQRELTSLEPAVALASRVLAAGAEDAAQRAALVALDAQGPAMARVLEALANAAPPGLTLRSVRAIPDGDHWKVSLEAFAANRDPIVARQTGDLFLRELAASAVFAEALDPPTRRIVPDTGGVELVASYRVRR
jgi:Tfp pilus assembly PilM family ATPase